VLNSPVWRGWPQYAFGVGLVVGGLLSAAVLVTVGSLVRLVAPPAFWAAMIAVWFAVVALREVGALSFGLPQNARLVPESVLRHGRFWGPFEFGLEMGTGVRTYVTSGLAYVVVPVLALLAGCGTGAAGRRGLRARPDRDDGLGAALRKGRRMGPSV
jgi:hypothetical protein